MDSFDTCTAVCLPFIEYHPKPLSDHTCRSRFWIYFKKWTRRYQTRTGLVEYTVGGALASSAVAAVLGISKLSVTFFVTDGLIYLENQEPRL